MRISPHLVLALACLWFCGLAHASDVSWLDEIAGNYYGGPAIKDCVISLPVGARRCNCLSIKKLTNTTASIEFDRHDLPNGYVCAGSGMAYVVNDTLVLCPNKQQDKSACITIEGKGNNLEFYSEGRSESFCGLRETVDGLRFLTKDRVKREVNCGP